MRFKHTIAIVLASIVMISCGGGGSGDTGLVADAGPDLKQTRFDTIALDGSRSQGALAYEWLQVDGPYATFDSGTGAAKRLVTLPSAGSYTFKLTIRNSNKTASDSVTVEASELPVLVIDEPSRPDATVTTANTFTISGSVNAPVVSVAAHPANQTFSYDAVLKADGTFAIADIPLAAGDNVFEVIASTKNGAQTQDTLVITQHPMAEFTTALKLSPATIPAGQSTAISASIDFIADEPGETLELVTWSNGKAGAVVAELTDNGDQLAGDDFRNDGEYAATFTITPSTAEATAFRVRTKDNEQALSNIATVDVFEQKNISSYQTALDRATNVVHNSNIASLLPGTAAYEQEKAQILTTLKDTEGVRQAMLAPDRQSIEVEYQSGVKNLVMFSSTTVPVQIPKYSPVSRATTALSPLPEPAVPGSFKVTYFSPFYNLNCSVATYRTGEDLRFLYLHPYGYDLPDFLTTDKATVENLKTGMQAGILDFFTHGALMTINGDQLSTLMAEDVTTEKNTQYKEDLDAGRILQIVYPEVITNCTTGERTLKIQNKYLITPAFVEHYVDRMPYSLVNIQACQIFDDGGKFASTFIKKGARAVLGFSGVAYDEYSAELTNVILYDLRNGMSLGDAVKHAKEAIGVNSAVWWANTQEETWGKENENSPTAELQLAGGSGARSFRLGKTEVINGSFEDRLLGWESQEHGAKKVVSRWTSVQYSAAGASGSRRLLYRDDRWPTDGKHMLVAATVGGEYAGVSQRLHIPPGAESLAISFRIVREITEEEGVDTLTVPWRQQEFLILLETEDGISHQLEKIIGHGSSTPGRWFSGAKCWRISEHLYDTRPDVPRCSQVTSHDTSKRYDISAFQGHVVTLKILVRDDTSPVSSLSEVQDIYALIDRVYLADANGEPVGHHH